jgi:hypothetical protein
LPLNVAQLNIGVTADTSQAKTAIQELNVTIASGAPAEQAVVSAIVAGQQQIVQAIANVNAAIQGSSQQMVQALARVAEEENVVANNAQRAAGSVGSFGAGGANALGQMNMAMIASGQNMGPVNAGIMLISQNLRRIPGDAGAGTQAIQILGGMLTALGVAAIAFAGPMHQAFQALSAQIQQTGHDITEYQDRLDQAVQHAQNLGRTQTDLENGLTVLTRGLGDAGKALDNQNLLMDLAAAKHESLAQAAKDLIRAYEGYGRGLKELGIDMVFSHNAQAGLDAAQRSAATAADAVTKATERYNEALQRSKDRAAENALKVDQLAQANLRLSDAQQSLADLEARQAAQNAVPRISAETTAVEHLADARQRLSDILAKIAAQDEIPVTNHAETAVRALEAAQARLNGIMAEGRDSMGLTLVEHDQLAMAADRVADAQQRMAAATGDHAAAGGTGQAPCRHGQWQDRPRRRGQGQPGRGAGAGRPAQGPAAGQG